MPASGQSVTSCIHDRRNTHVYRSRPHSSLGYVNPSEVTAQPNEAPKLAGQDAGIPSSARTGQIGKSAIHFLIGSPLKLSLVFSFARTAQPFALGSAARSATRRSVEAVNSFLSFSSLSRSSSLHVLWFEQPETNLGHLLCAFALFAANTKNKDARVIFLIRSGAKIRTPFIWWAN